METYSQTPITNLINQLGTKLERVRKRLVSYGWSPSQVSKIILLEFLKIEETDWKLASTTNAFYKAKNDYQFNTQTTQIILCLQNIVPNFEVRQVCEYLQKVLQYNAFQFGINVCQSSSDSSQDFTNLKINKNRLKWKHSQKIKKRKTHFKGEDKPKKKIHDLCQQYQEKDADEKCYPEEESHWQILTETKKLSQNICKKRPHSKQFNQEEKIEKKVKKQ